MKRITIALSALALPFLFSACPATGGASGMSPEVSASMSRITGIVMTGLEARAAYEVNKALRVPNQK